MYSSRKSSKMALNFTSILILLVLFSSLLACCTEARLLVEKTSKTKQGNRNMGGKETESESSGQLAESNTGSSSNYKAAKDEFGEMKDLSPFPGIPGIPFPPMIPGFPPVSPPLPDIPIFKPPFDNIPGVPPLPSIPNLPPLPPLPSTIPIPFLSPPPP